MVQPKYSPEEALERVKLMMEYDSSKTYTENKVIVENKQILNEEFITAGALTAAGWWAITALAAATGGAIAYGNEYATADVKGKISIALGACDKVTGDAAKTSMTEAEHAKIASIFRKLFCISNARIYKCWN
jgi:hypothetical protein